MSEADRDLRDTGVEWLGAIPSHWKLAPFRALLGERTAKNDGAKVEEYLSLLANIGVVPYAEKGDIGNKRPDDLSKCKIVEPGDLLINSMNYGIGSFGLSRYLGVCSPVYIVLRPKDQTVDVSFAYRLLQSRAFQIYAQSFGNGILAHRAAIGFDTLKSLTMPLPPVAEQVAIAAFLDRETRKIDALVEEQKRLIALLKEKRQAVISHAVTKGLDPNVRMKPSGVEWLGDVPEHWAVAPVGMRYEVQLGRMLNEERAHGTHMRPYLRVLDVQWGKINTEDLPHMDFPPDAQQRYRLRPGDLMINEGGSYVGRSAIWLGELEECYYQKALHRLRPHTEHDTTAFFYYVMEMATQRGVFVAEGNQTTIDHLTAEQLRRKRFAFPPIDEQRLIASRLDNQLREYQKLIESAEVAARLLQERRSALISAAVTGKIDVRDHTANEEAA